MTTRTISSKQAVRPGKHVRRRPGVWLLLGLWFGLLLLLAISGVTALQLRYAGRIYPGVRVAGVELNELTRSQAAARLQERLMPYQGPDILLRFDDQAWSLSGATLGLEVDADATAQLAYEQGRRASPLAALAAQWQLLRDGVDLAPVVRVGEAQVNDLLNRIAQAIEQPARDAAIAIEGVQVVVTPAQVGRDVDLQTTWAAVQTRLAQGSGGVVDVVVREIQPTVGDVEATAAQAQRLLRQPLFFSFAGDAANDEPPQMFAVDPVQVAAWLRIIPQIGANGAMTLALQTDEAAVRAFVAGLAESLARPARSARLDFDPATTRLSVLTPSQPGRALAVNETITRTLAALSAGSAAVELPLQIVKPEVDMRDLEQMGIRELVASGVTVFKGSTATRVANIVQGARQLQGVVIPPDGIFSFNRAVGDVSAANGYEDSLVIWGDRTAVGIGGGICQVSTTVFRAAFWGGMPIVERWAHGYVVSWYGEPGMDATIYTPSVDFRFRNDTGAYLLVESDVDLAQGRLTINLYGSKPARTVEKVGPEISNVRKPEPPLNQLDPTLAPGAKKQVDWAVDGRDVVVTRIIKQGDQVVRQEKFVSKYQPWRAVFLVGPTLPPPPGQ